MLLFIMCLSSCIDIYVENNNSFFLVYSYGPCIQSLKAMVKSINYISVITTASLFVLLWC